MVGGGAGPLLGRLTLDEKAWKVDSRCWRRLPQATRYESFAVGWTGVDNSFSTGVRLRWTGFCPFCAAVLYADYVTPLPRFHTTACPQPSPHGMPVLSACWSWGQDGRWRVYGTTEGTGPLESRKRVRKAHKAAGRKENGKTLQACTHNPGDDHSFCNRKEVFSAFLTYTGE
jgi:hypothetical protein